MLRISAEVITSVVRLSFGSVKMMFNRIEPWPVPPTVLWLNKALPGLTLTFSARRVVDTPVVFRAPPPAGAAPGGYGP